MWGWSKSNVTDERNREKLELSDKNLCFEISTYFNLDLKMLMHYAIYFWR